jgi:hypothetical protein
MILRGHDLDLLIERTRPAGSAHLPDVVRVGDIPATHVFLGVDLVWWSTPRQWHTFIALILGGIWPPGAKYSGHGGKQENERGRATGAAVGGNQMEAR